MVNGFGGSRAIPYTDLCMASGGERKLPLIAHYRSSKSTAQDVRMALDLEAPDWMVEINLDGGSKIDKGICRDL